MITSILLTIACLVAWVTRNRKNPIKMCILLLTGARLNATARIISTGVSCISFILIIIFIGGIIIIFIILCSILPNQRGDESPRKITPNTRVWLSLIILSRRLTFQRVNKNSIIKTFIERNQNIIMIVTIITIYFIAFNKTIRSRKTRIRRLYC